MSGLNSAINPAAAVSSLLGPLYSDIWAAITSDLGVLTADILATATSFPYTTSTPARMTTTIDITVPFSTITIDSTILRTSFITVTVGLPPSSARASSPTPTAPTNTLIPQTTSTSSGSETSFPAIATHTSIPTTTFSFSPSMQPTPLTGSATSASGVQATSASSSSRSQSQKHAVIGGLCGAIAGFLLIGLLICLILRLRRKRAEPDEFSLNEKGMRPSLVRKLTHLTAGRASPRPALAPIEESPRTTVDEDQSIIRMNTQHWPRPFVSGEGFRDSMPPGTLRVTNPDTSRPGTPRRSSDTIGGGFLRRQRSELTRAFSKGRRPRTNSSQHYGFAYEVPEIRIEPVHPQESAAPQRPAPSFKSYPSISSLSVIRQHPLEDPFLSPPQNLTRPPPAPPQESTTPTGTPPSHNVGSILRSWGSYLNPFRSRSNTITPEQQTNLRAVSHFSASTWSSRPSRRSDPFDLDRASMRGSSLPARLASEFARRGRSSKWILYEGT